MTVITPAFHATSEDTRATIGEAIGRLNAEAKKISRRGRIGTRGVDYEVIHARINAAVTDYWAAAE